MRAVLALIIAVLIVSCARSVNAQNGDGHHVLWRAPGIELSHANVDWEHIDELATANAMRWAPFARTLGTGWRVNFDAAFGAPQWILGSFDTGSAPLSTARAIALSESFFKRLAIPLGLDEPETLRRWFAESTTNRHGQRIAGVDYVQVHKGYEVRTIHKPLRVRTRWNLTLGRLSAIGSEAVRGLDVDVSNPIDRRTAIRLAREHLPPFAPGTGAVRGVDTFILVGTQGEGRVRARLVHAVRIDVHGSDPHGWLVVIDAKRGDRLYVADHLCHADVVGTVAIGLLPRRGGVPPTAPFAVLPAQDLLVTSTVGTGHTDAAGRFRIPHGGTAPVTVAGQLRGRWATVVNRAAANLTFSSVATPGVPVNLVVNGTHASELQSAETTAYYWTTFTRHLLAAEWVGWQGLGGLPVNVNLNQSCNAFYNAGTISFFRSSAACSNTAISDVVAHEYGHAFHEHFFGSISNGQFSEGIGDHLGLYARSDYDGRVHRHLGEGFFAAGGGIRDYRAAGAANNTQWPSQGKSPHKGGEIWAGAMADLADNLVNKHGFAAGFAIAKNVSLAMFSRRPADMPPGILEIFLQDDNDADPTNGSPNFYEIAAAADRHAIPRPPNPTVVQFAHAPLATTADVVNGYPVVAVIRSSAAAIARATLHYQIGGGRPTAVPLARLGNLFFAAIPAQRAVTGVRYWLSAVDGRQNVGRLPATGTFGFEVGREVVALRDDVEADRGWRADPSDTATTGRFERADPHAASVGTLVAQPENDTTANGVFCWVTQNGARGQTASAHDVDNGATSIVSPRMDLRALAPGAARMTFNYWLTMYTQVNDALRIDVSSDDGGTWASVWSVATSSAAWRTAAVNLPGPYTNRMRVRFRVGDNPNDSLTDCLIDDILVRVLDDNVAELRASTRTPALGTTLTYSLRAAREPGRAFVHVISFNPGAPRIPGVGRLAVGLPFYAVWFGVTDATGQARFRVPIPNQPALRGLDVYSQALVAGSAMVLSNLWQIELR